MTRLVVDSTRCFVSVPARGNFFMWLFLSIIYFAFDLTDFANSFVDEKNNNCKTKNSKHTTEQLFTPRKRG